MTGDALFCSVRFNHVVIVSNESFKTLFGPLHLSATLGYISKLYIKNLMYRNTIFGASDHLSGDFTALVCLFCFPLLEYLVFQWKDIYEI
jgi:hypothetical protein